MAKPTRYDVDVNVWEERDRLRIEVRNRKTDKTVAEWWDDDARQMFEDGFFKPGIEHRQLDQIASPELKNSVFEYLEEMGMLAVKEPVVRHGEEAKRHWKQINPPNLPKPTNSRTYRFSDGCEIMSRDLQGAEDWHKAKHKGSERKGKYIIKHDRIGNILITHTDKPGDAFLQFESDKQMVYEILKKGEKRDLDAGWPVEIKEGEPRATILSGLWETNNPKR